MIEKMTNDNFDGQVLSEKLKKLNNSQQAIESLSQWCITHRKKARQIVNTWHELFKSSQREHCVCFLYLANDILQNSRRKGNDFVNEFWKVLPSSLKYVHEKGDEYGKKAVTRLVDIWEERKVFGSRGHSLKDEMLTKDPPPQVSNGKISNIIRIGKRDAHAVRIKVAVGAWPEKLLTAFQCVQDDPLNEEAALMKCDEAFFSIGRLIEANRDGEEEVDFLNQIRDHETTINKWLGKLENVQENRGTLISYLKEALLDHEIKIEQVRTKIQMGRKLIEEVGSIHQKLLSNSERSPLNTTPVTTTSPLSGISEKPSQPTHPLSQLNPLLSPPSLQHLPTFAPSQTGCHPNTKAAAAAMAAKLAASTSSAQMLTSVLSSLVAEEAATMMDTKLNNTSIFQSPEKRQKLGQNNAKSTTELVPSTEMESISQLQPQQPVLNTPFIPNSHVIQQPILQMPPIFPPLPQSLPPTQHSTGQYIPSSTALMGGSVSFGYGVNGCRPPPPMVSHVPMGMMRPLNPPLSGQQQQPSEQQSPHQKQVTPSVIGGYYQLPPGVGFHGLAHQPTTPSMSRQ